MLPFSDVEGNVFSLLSEQEQKKKNRYNKRVNNTVFFVLDIEFSIIKMNESFNTSLKTFLSNRSF